MAKTTITVLTDDLDGTEGDTIETVVFGFDGASYEIDLSEKNRDKLEKALTPFLNKARKASGPRTAAKRGATRRDPSQTQAIREWASKNGHTVSERGRLSAEVVAAYEKAH